MFHSEWRALTQLAVWLQNDSAIGVEKCVMHCRLFEMGFAEQLRAILGGMPESRQTLLFSATMPQVHLTAALRNLLVHVPAWDGMRVTNPEASPLWQAQHQLHQVTA